MPVVRLQSVFAVGVLIATMLPVICAQTYTREYIRLTGRVIAIENGALARGDADADGVPEVYLQFTDGSMGIWYLSRNGNQLLVSGFAFAAGPSSGITLVDVADVNGDGIPDLILRFSDTSIGVWFMSAPQGQTIASFAFISGPIQGWVPVGMADLNADGRSDLIIQYTDGSIGVWYLGGPQGNQIQSFAPISGPVSDWKVVGVADLNRDGHPDVIIQKMSDKTIGVWYLGGLQGNQIQSFASIAGSSTWSVVGTTDTNADGYPDLLIRNTDGSLGVWYLGGSQGNTITAFAPVTGPSTYPVEIAAH